MKRVALGGALDLAPAADTNARPLATIGDLKRRSPMSTNPGAKLP